MSKSRLVKIGLLAVTLISVYFLGYFRNYVFETINGQTAAVYYHDTRPSLPAFLEFLLDKDYKSLIRIKAVLTVFFAFIYFLTALLSIRQVFIEKTYSKLCSVFYGSLIIISLLFILIGVIFPSFSDHAYNIARNLMHIAQSPFTILLLIMVIYASKRTLKT